MRSYNLIAMTLLAIFSVTVSGCGGSGAFAPVSGTVTYDGKPVAKLRVTFSPEPVGENYAVGPYSKGTTDDQGNFTLKTRYDDTGAVIGKHKLGFQYSDIGETAMADLIADMSDARDSGAAEVAKVKDKIAKLKAKLKGRPLLQFSEIMVDVPAGGLTDYKLELKDYAPTK